MKWIEFRSGMRDSVPVCIGYFSVSFGFGALAVTCGLEVLQATLISLTNLTSAGQFAGLTVIAASASLMDMVLTQAVINSRYALMGLALSQKLGREITTIPRLVISFFITDEIFALAMERTRALTIQYMMGLAALPILGWVGGTLFGAAAAERADRPGRCPLRNVYCHRGAPVPPGKALPGGSRYRRGIELHGAVGSSASRPLSRHRHRSLHGDRRCRLRRSLSH